MTARQKACLVQKNIVERSIITYLMPPVLRKLRKQAIDVKSGNLYEMKEEVVKHERERKIKPYQWDKKVPRNSHNSQARILSIGLLVFVPDPSRNDRQTTENTDRFRAEPDV